MVVSLKRQASGKSPRRKRGRSRPDASIRQVMTQDPVDSARLAGLWYVTDKLPGIERKKRGKGFRYVGPDGKPIRDPQELRRIRSLAIPPAWQDVWICPIPEGHLQSTGRDARGRKQFRYHPQWRTKRDENKFDRMAAFGIALPNIRKRVNEHIEQPGLSREKVLATVVRLLEITFIRVGNEEYARDNGSFGLTTMHDRHVDFSGSTLNFRFRGKSGKYHRVRLTNRRLAKIVKQCRDIPGAELFQYMDEQGERHTIDSGDVNSYLREISGMDFTAKDFRTWAGTVLAAMALQEFERVDKKAQAKKNIVQAIENVAERLGNTPSVCRKCYVHPAILDAYMDGELLETLRNLVSRDMEQLHQLRPEEAAVLALLKRRLSNDNGSA